MAAEGFLVGYHGCDRSFAQRVLLGQANLNPSSNAYDWLGEGIYFWENNPLRAFQWAQFQKQRGKVETPFVLGALINYGRCLDLISAAGIEIVQNAHEKLVQIYDGQADTLPTNRSIGTQDQDLVLRYLDCRVINLVHALHRHRPFDTVRGMFTEGVEAYPGAGFRARTHTQVAVVNPGMIRGVFLPREEEMTPLLPPLV